MPEARADESYEAYLVERLERALHLAGCARSEAERAAHLRTCCYYRDLLGSAHIR